MTTAEDYAWLADRVYAIDPKWPGPPLRSDDTFYTGDNSSKQRWQVIDVAANAQNGFQGMAVVPVVNDLPDYSRITIAFAERTSTT